MRCPRCGAQVETDEKTCRICGEQLTDELIEDLEILEKIDEDGLPSVESGDNSSYTHKREIILNVITIIITVILTGLIVLPLVLGH